MLDLQNTITKRKFADRNACVNYKKCGVGAAADDDNRNEINVTAATRKYL